MEKNNFWRLEKDVKGYFEDIYFKGSGKGIKGGEMNALFESLSEKCQEREYYR
jgi:hypothetical protein